MRENPLRKAQIGPRLAGSAIRTGSQTSAALGSGPEKPGGSTPTIS